MSLITAPHACLSLLFRLDVYLCLLFIYLFFTVQGRLKNYKMKILFTLTE